MPNIFFHKQSIHKHAGIVCPKCGSTDIRKTGHRVTLRGWLQRWQCGKGHTFYLKSDYVKKRNRK